MINNAWRPARSVLTPLADHAKHRARSRTCYPGGRDS
jgi:hypothetical protein